MDEIDRALAELALKGGGTPAAAAPATGHTTARLEPKWQAVKDAYAVDPKFLDADAELRRLFGSKVVRTSLSFSVRTHADGRSLDQHDDSNASIATPRTVRQQPSSFDLPPSRDFLPRRARSRLGTPLWSPHRLSLRRSRIGHGRRRMVDVRSLEDVQGGSVGVPGGVAAGGWE